MENHVPAVLYIYTYVFIHLYSCCPLWVVSYVHVLGHLRVTRCWASIGYRRRRPGCCSKYGGKRDRNVYSSEVCKCGDNIGRQHQSETCNRRDKIGLFRFQVKVRWRSLLEIMKSQYVAFSHSHLTNPSGMKCDCLNTAVHFFQCYLFCAVLSLLMLSATCAWTWMFLWHLTGLYRTQRKASTCKPATQQIKPVTQAKRSRYTQAQLRRRQREKRAQKSRGYCEICEVRFEDINQVGVHVLVHFMFIKIIDPSQSNKRQ